MQTIEILLLLPFSMLFCSIVFSDSAFFLVVFFPEVFLTTELQNSEFVKTYSVGEGDRRRVVIAKK